MRYVIKLFPIILGLMLSSMLITRAFSAYPIPNVTLYVVDGTESYFLTTLTGIPLGEEISDGTYLGWCVETDTTLERSTPHTVTLYSSLNPPTFLAGEAWDKVNYILNHKQGGRIDIQAAIWYFIKLDPRWTTPGYYTYDPFGDNRYGGNPPSDATKAMVDDALANGSGYIPGPGDVVAIICVPIGDHQISIVELPIPPEKFQGLTPGFWKNHLEAWEDYSPEDSLDDVFENNGIGVPLDQYTLLDALRFKGGRSIAGAERILLRAAVAAILNAAHPDINYPLTTAEIIDAVNYALQSDDRAAILELAQQLDNYNNLGL